MRDRWALRAAAALLLAAVLGGCGDDDPTETSKEPAEGVSGSVGQIQVRDLFVLGGRSGVDIPVGGSAPVYFTLINGPATAETAGESGQIEQPPGADLLVGVSSPSAASGQIVGGPVKAPAGENVVVGPQARVVLDNVAKPLASGENVQLTLTFKNAGSVSFNAPIQAQEDDLTTYSPAPG